MGRVIFSIVGAFFRWIFFYRKKKSFDDIFYGDGNEDIINIGVGLGVLIIIVPVLIILYNIIA